MKNRILGRRGSAAALAVVVVCGTADCAAADASAGSSASAQFVTYNLPTPPSYELTNNVSPALLARADGRAVESPAPTTFGQTFHFNGWSDVGALFTAPVYSHGKLTGAAHECSASVVDSPAGDLVLTAAHCVYGSAFQKFLAFAPKFDNGVSGYGVWYVRSISVDAGWVSSHNPLDDYALLTIDPVEGRSIQRVAGGLALSATHLPRDVTVLGYNQVVYDPDGNAPIICHSQAVKEVETVDGVSELYSGFAGPNFQDGTSGGPWIETGTDHVVGVVGGYEEGGDIPAFSYSSVFGPDVFALYRDAVDQSRT
ncbi:MAG TPA: trypsin-like serine protease [Actinocrinis sp.]|jgi:hypothetical protein